MRQYLQSPSGQYEPTYFTTVYRYQLHYHPKSGTEINYERLPPHEQMAGMQLAYREQQYTDSAIDHFMHTKLLFILLATLAGTLALVLVGPVIPLWQALSGAGGVTFLANLFFAYKRQFTLARLIKAFLVPVIGVLATAALSRLVTHRVMATAAIGTAALILCRMYGGELFLFYRDWLYTHPRLRPATRAAPKKITTRPDLIYLGVVFVIAAVVTIYSPSAAMLAIIVLSIVLAWKTERGAMGWFGWRLLPLARYALAQFLTYGSTTTGAPGVWLPRTLLPQRQMHLIVVAGAVYLTLTIGLCVFFPWDLVAPQLFEAVVGEPPQGPLDPRYLGFRFNMADKPHGWLLVTTGAMFQDPMYIWSYPIALALAVVLPNLVLIVAYRRPIVEAERLRREIDGDGQVAVGGTVIDADGRSEWQWYVDRLRNSPHATLDALGRTVRESGHLFLGVEPRAQFPVLLEKSILAEHAYIVGQSGSGKTSLALMPMLIQLMRGAAASDLSPPVVLLDLKGDPALFATAKAESEARRKALGIDDSTPEGRNDPRCAFRFFTPEAGKASHYFNPFNSLQGDARTLIQTCQLLLESLSLNHGEGYGRSYYSRRSRMLLFQALKHQSKPSSFDQLYEVLKSDEFRKEGNESLELLSVIEALTQYPQIAMTRNLKKPEQAIHMPSVLEHRQVVYFWLPAAIESVSVREIGKVALFCLLSASIERQRGGKEPVQAYLIIDEFQRLAGDNFRIVLEQARSFGIGAILANQTQSDLKTPDMDLRGTVRTNTRFKQYFSVGDPGELSDLVLLSGQELSNVKGWSQSSTSNSEGGSTTVGTSQNETLKPRLTINDVLRISDHPLESIVHVSRGEGYTQFGGTPVPVRSTWPIPLEVYKARQREPWPDVGAYEEDIIAKGSSGPLEIDRERDLKMALLIADKLKAFAEGKQAGTAPPAPTTPSPPKAPAGLHANGTSPHA